MKHNVNSEGTSLFKSYNISPERFNVISDHLADIFHKFFTKKGFGKAITAIHEVAENDEELSVMMYIFGTLCERSNSFNKELTRAMMPEVKLSAN